MRVTVTLAINVPGEDLTVKSIEEAVAHAQRKFSNMVWQAFVSKVESAAKKQYPPGKLKVKAWEERTLLTMSGPVKFQRHRFECVAEDKSILLFDMRVGLKPYQRVTEAVEERLAETAGEVSYAKSARFWTKAWMSRISPMAVWHSTQRVGRKIRDEEEKRRREVFKCGELPGWERDAPPFVGVEADSTYLSAWRGRGRAAEVYVGMAYTGKDRRGNRRMLTDKWICTGVRGSYGFGKDLFVMAQEKHNVSGAEVGVFLSDGAGSLRAIQEEHFPWFRRQVDWAHAKRRIAEAYGKDRVGRASELVGMLMEGKVDGVCKRIRKDACKKRKRAETLKQLAGYLEANGKDLYAVRRMREEGITLPEHLEGSGGIERQVGVVAGQRMKRQGMSWTRDGADNLLAVRTRLLNRLQSSKPRIA